jgi:hypothetical protein
MLAVSGGFDMRTPTSGAQSVVSRFPQGHLLVVPGVGHSTVTADPSGCAINSVRSWMLDQAFPSTCPRSKPQVSPVSALPAAGQAHPKKPLTPRATYAVAKQTLQDALALALMGAANPTPGLYSGRLTIGAGKLTLSNFSDSRGVSISGTLTVKAAGPPLVFQGALTVGGTAASHGVLGVSGASLRGALGGRPVG